MSAGDTGRYCTECGDWFGYIEGNEGRAYCSDDCEQADAFCDENDHIWVGDGPMGVACDSCPAEGRIVMLRP